MKSALGGIAVANLRSHRNGFAAVFITVFSAALLVCALGVLFESGIRGGATPHRLAGADVVVGGPQSLAVPEDLDQPYGERVRLPASTVGELAALPDVESAVGDINVPLSNDSGRVFDAHGWSSASLAPYRIIEGNAPTRADEVVTTDPRMLGEQVMLRHGGVGRPYTVVGLASTSTAEPSGRPTTIFMTDGRAQELWPHSDTVAAIGLIAREGVDPAALASQVGTQLRGLDVDTYTGAARADAEYVDIGSARGELAALSAAVAGVALMIAVFVVSSTLSSSIQQRRRDFALLRSMGATPRQVHRLIGAEVWVVSGVAALLGVAPGYTLAAVLRHQFADAGILPPDFSLAMGPVPALVAVVAAVVTARIAAAISARRPARLDPVDALREAAVEAAALGRTRIVVGVLTGIGGLMASLLPAFVPGPAAIAGAGSSAILLIIAAALLGPILVSGAMRVFSGRMASSGSASAVLAAANLSAHRRRLASAIMPLALAIAFGSVQLFSQSTLLAAAEDQTERGTLADLVVTGPAGVDPQLAATIAAMDSVSAANPITRSQALYTKDTADAPITEVYSVQGIDPGAAGSTLDLDVREGDLGKLAAGSVALSRDAAAAMSADLGDTITVRLGDGAVVTATVIATYNRGFGFGDITLPGTQVREHTTSGLVDHVLVSAAPGRMDDVRRAIEATGGVTALSSNEFASAIDQEQREQDSVTPVVLAVLLGFLGIAVVNTMVLMTTDRRREFALLQLVGASTRQVRAMMRRESLAAVALAATIGTLVAYPPLAGIAIAVSGEPFPTISVWTYAVLVSGATLLGFVAITGTARRVAHRDREALGIGA
ncbi:ABC transporter permease [Williamsia sp. 1138]|uniref:ABC transporter permease n=1 Tax=Williamsia sp. 1138 TaxID=1903117 RepID=UPI000A109840|nr:ABC transporter permease [Williamsia sp. 1138]OZG26326.1 ABC transporter permease [Williamsia sp. 1138]